MTVVTQKFIRKPLYVDAVRVSTQNFDDVVGWCQGETLQDEVSGEETGKPYIKVRVHNPKNARQTKAFVGDWILYTERGYKVYTNKAFHASFDRVQNDSEPVIPDEPLGEPSDYAAQSLEDSMKRDEDWASNEPPLPTGTVETAPEQEKITPEAVEGKLVLSMQDQQEMDADEIRELIRSGDAVLAQDIADESTV